MNFRFLAAVGLFFVLGVTGCGPRYVVIRQSVPSALSGIGTYTVQPDFANTMVLRGTEANHLAGKDAAWIQDWENGKLGMHAQVIARLQGEGTGATFNQGQEGTAQGHITVRYTHIDPGQGGVWAPRGARVTARVIFSVGGAATDEIEVTGVSGASNWSGAAGRMANAGGGIGIWAGRYIKNTTGPQPTQ